MSSLHDLTVLGAGATATVYLQNENRILKVFNSNYSFESVKYEAFLSSEINKTSIKAPTYYDMISIENKNVIVSEYVPGKLLINQFVESDFFSCIKLIKRMVATQKEIHRAKNDAITSEIARYTYLISNSGLEESKQQQLLALLKKQRQSDSVCHGDFHPGNIIINSSDTLYTIDWMNCYHGNFEGDVCRSYLTLITPFDPFNLSPVKKVLFQFYKRIIGRVYLHEYLRKTDLRRRDITRWIPIVAAGRLADNVPNEREWLTKIIDRNMKHLTASSSRFGGRDTSVGEI